MTYHSRYVGTYGQYGSMIGGTIGSIIPFVGTAIGSLIGGVVGGLIGPSAHYTPSGMLYDQAAQILKSQATELADLQNQLYAATGNPKRVVVPTWTYTSADDPKTGPYIAQILNAPQYAKDTSPAPLIQDQADGVYDNVIQVQKILIQAIEQALAGLQDGTLVVSAGTIVSAGSPVAQDANSTVAQNSQPNSQSCSQSCSGGLCSAGTANFLAANSGYILGGLGVLGLFVLLAKRRRG